MKVKPPEGIANMLRQLRNPLTLLGIVFIALATLPWNASCSAATIIGAPVVLSTLLDGGTIVAGDKTFTNFTYNFTGEMPGPILVNVIPIQDDSGNFGIRFQGAFIDLPSSQGGSDALITYKVSADATHLISDAHLDGNLTLLGNVGSISVTETFFPLGQNGEYTMKIFDDETSTDLSDVVFFAPPVMMLTVQKDIQAIAVAGTQSVVGSFVDQTFSQIVIPEPATSMLLLSSVVAFGFARRRGVLRQ